MRTIAQASVLACPEHQVVGIAHLFVRHDPRSGQPAAVGSLIGNLGGVAHVAGFTSGHVRGVQVAVTVVGAEIPGHVPVRVFG